MCKTCLSRIWRVCWLELFEYNRKRGIAKLMLEFKMPKFLNYRMFLVSLKTSLKYHELPKIPPAIRPEVLECNKALHQKTAVITKKKCKTGEHERYTRALLPWGKAWPPADNISLSLSLSGYNKKIKKKIKCNNFLHEISCYYREENKVSFDIFFCIKKYRQKNQ